MEIVLIGISFILLMCLFYSIGQWLTDLSSLDYSPFRLGSSYRRMMEEVEIQRERQQPAIKAARIARKYDQKMSKQRAVGEAQMQAISKAYVRKVQELTRRP